ncbi:permease [Thermogymnomonas acidicola]|uniref:Permease n=1 Tax=Thermogymnomonas acidicola TaxID=399579 RepID=A0AA37BRY7_9ARCH|nr:SLC13 family permease [Thermogymnomonas acidicola]GGM76148.1 permease [Thermogymnomonas acidicola]
MDHEQVYVIVILVASVALLITNRIRYDLVGLGTVLALVLLHIVSPTAAIENFGSIPVITLALVMITSKTIANSGILDKVGDILIRRLKNEYVILAIIFLLVGVLSGFMSDVALTVMMIPLFFYIADKMGRSSSKYLMPLAFVAVLGGRYTVLSTSSNIVLYDLWYQKTGSFLPFFQFFIPGFIILIIGIPVLLIISRIMPNRKNPVSTIEGFKTGEYLTEAEVQGDSPLVGRTLGEVEKQFSIRVVSVYPGRLSSPERVLAAGDILVIRVRPENIPALSGIRGLRLAPSEKMTPGDSVAEVFVMPDSRLVGSTISESQYVKRYNISIIGISAYGKRIIGRLRTVKISAGDVILLSGKEEDIAEFISQMSLAPMHKRDIRILSWRDGLISLGALALAVALSELGLDIVYAFLIAVLILVATRTLNFKSMYQYVEWQIVVFVGCFLSLGSALTSSGIITYLGHVVAGSPLFLFLMTVLLANTIGNVGAAIIMGPVAIGFPSAVKALTVVAMAASSTFMTPFGNQSNLVVLSPGGYRPRDYLVFGSIITVEVMALTLAYTLL